MKESLDWDYVRKELEKIKLAQFERCMCDLVSVWFEEKAETEFYAQLTEIADAKRNIRNDYKL